MKNNLNEVPSEQGDLWNPSVTAQKILYDLAFAKETEGQVVGTPLPWNIVLSRQSVKDSVEGNVPPLH